MVPPSAPPPAAPPARVGPGPVRYGPSVLRYVVERHIENTQEYTGTAQRTVLGFRIYVTAAIHTPTDSTGLPAVFTIDSMSVDSGVVLPAFINLDLARGLTFSGTLTAAGEFRDGTPSNADVARSLSQIIGGFRDFYPRIPPQGITLGTAWTDTVSHTDQFGVIDQVRVTAIDQAQAAAWEDRGGVRSLRLEMKSTVSLTGTGQQGGMPVELVGAGTRAAVEYIAADGRYLGGVSRDSTALQITLHAQSTVVPVRQVALSIIQVLP